MSTETSNASKQKRGLFGRLVDRISGIGLFVRQVVSELRKVVRPSRNELVTFTVAVFFFVMIVMMMVSAIDYGVGKLVLWVFAGGAS